MTEKILENSKKALLPVWARVILILILFVLSLISFQYLGLLIVDISVGDSVAIDNMGVIKELIMQFSMFVAFFLPVFLFRRFIDRKSIKSMGFSLKNRGKDILAGLIFPLAIIGGGSLLLYNMGFIYFSNVDVNITSLLINFTLFIQVAISEELLFRGYILNNLLESMNKYWALLISALIFALLHGLNFNISWLGFTNLIISGILLGAAYIYTKNLWFAISFHLFWNYIEGPVLGFQVSGNKMESLTKINTLGDKFFSGGEFGFEGSILCTAFCIISILLIMRHYNRIKPAVDVI